MTPESQTSARAYVEASYDRQSQREALDRDLTQALFDVFDGLLEADHSPPLRARQVLDHTPAQAEMGWRAIPTKGRESAKVRLPP